MFDTQLNPILLEINGFPSMMVHNRQQKDFKEGKLMPEMFDMVFDAHPDIVGKYLSNNNNKKV